jgi:hypothetical protein
MNQPRPSQYGSIGRFLVLCGLFVITFSLTCSQNKQNDEAPQGLAQSQPNNGVVDGSIASQGPGRLAQPELGFSLSYPTEWTGEDAMVQGLSLNYAKAKDWTVDSDVTRFMSSVPPL